jgi:hypothetical protein
MPIPVIAKLTVKKLLQNMFYNLDWRAGGTVIYARTTGG